MFLGRSVTQHKNMGDDTARIIDEEVRMFIDRNYDRAKLLLTDNIDILHTMAAALIKYETIDSHQIDELMAGRDAPPPSDWDDNIETPTDKGSGSSKVREAKGDGSIGGPASQH